VADKTITSPFQQDVWDRLDNVMDPELDEPVTDMGFIEEVLIDGENAVEVAFRLPTYWCSPNFAFLMAQGIKQEVEMLPWVARVRLRLEDHLSAEDICAAVNEDRNFDDVFAELTDGGDLVALREKFDVKAFQRRQEAVIKALLAEGYSVVSIVALTLGEFSRIDFADKDDARQKRRYTELLLSKNIAKLSNDLALPTYAGKPVSVEGFGEYQAELRSVRINMEFSGALCRGLKRSRYKEVQMVDGEPTLVDFIMDRVPEAADRAPT
jgi:metal-sulfur cluster biosynthetic enzyme